MTPVSTNSTTTDSTVWRLNSPIPYLFGGLALMLGLITIALILLICSHRKQAHSTPSGDAGDRKRPGTDEADLRPKILVIMAGNTKPTFLATPISSSSTSEKKSCDVDDLV